MFINFGPVSIYEVLVPILNETISVCVTILTLIQYYGKYIGDKEKEVRIFCFDLLWM